MNIEQCTGVYLEVNLYVSQQTRTGLLCALARRAVWLVPTVARTHPLAITPCKEGLVILI